MGQRGTALLTTLGLMLLLLPVGVYVLLLCRTDLMIQRNFRYEMEAFYVAEAGLDHALADIRPGQSFAGVLAGPDGIAGTADDGLFPFVEGAPLEFPFPPFRYEVHVTASVGDAVSVVSRGSGRRGAAKVVGAVVARSPLVWTPAALYGQCDVTHLDLGDGRFMLSGFDHRVNDAPAEPTGTAEPVPALGGADADEVEVLRRTLDNEQAARFVGAGGPPSIATAAAADVSALVAEIARREDCLRLTEVAAAEFLQLGTTDAPRLAVVSGDADVGGRVTGSGVLVVEGQLHVTGQFEYAGLVVVLGEVLFDPSSEAVVAGAFWHAAGGGRAPELRGRGAVLYSSQALAQVDAAFPALLPHAAVMTAWYEPL